MVGTNPSMRSTTRATGPFPFLPDPRIRLLAPIVLPFHSLPPAAFPHIAPPFPTITQPFPNIGKPLPIITQPHPYFTPPFFNLIQPFPDIGNPFSNITKPFPLLRSRFPLSRSPSPRLGNPLPTFLKAFPILRNRFSILQNQFPILGSPSELAENPCPQWKTPAETPELQWSDAKTPCSHPTAHSPNPRPPDPVPPGLHLDPCHRNHLPDTPCPWGKIARPIRSPQQFLPPPKLRFYLSPYPKQLTSRLTRGAGIPACQLRGIFAPDTQIFARYRSAAVCGAPAAARSQTPRHRLIPQLLTLLAAAAGLRHSRAPGAIQPALCLCGAGIPACQLRGILAPRPYPPTGQINRRKNQCRNL